MNRLSDKLAKIFLSPAAKGEVLDALAGRAMYGAAVPEELHGDSRTIGCLYVGLSQHILANKAVSQQRTSVEAQVGDAVKGALAFAMDVVAGNTVERSEGEDLMNEIRGANKRLVTSEVTDKEYMCAVLKGAKQLILTSRRQKRPTVALKLEFMLPVSRL